MIFRYTGDNITIYFITVKKTVPLSASLSIISFNAASILDTALLIMPMHTSVGTLVSDQSLTEGWVLRDGKFYRETQHSINILVSLES